MQVSGLFKFFSADDAFPLNRRHSADTDNDGNGDVSALTDGLLALRYLFGLTGDALISGVIASDATGTTSAEIEAHIQSLTPAM